MDAPALSTNECSRCALHWKEKETLDKSNRWGGKTGEDLSFLVAYIVALPEGRHLVLPLASLVVSDEIQTGSCVCQ